VETAGLGEELGEPDNICFPIPASLTPTARENVGQVLLTMMDDSATQPSPLFIRNILESQLEQLKDNNQYPCMAFELEFYLIDKQRTPS
ncbi:glutamine synthetase, partial [Vibrio sp. 10N.222.49.C9]